jgi:hypothetical protein
MGEVGRCQPIRSLVPQIIGAQSQGGERNGQEKVLVDLIIKLK